jgi:hypothetical protein
MLRFFVYVAIFVLVRYRPTEPGFTTGRGPVR